jgi:hypothetical protein
LHLEEKKRNLEGRLWQAFKKQKRKIGHFLMERGTQAGKLARKIGDGVFPSN